MAVESVIKKNNLWLLRILGVLPDHYVSWMCITMNHAMNENHLAKGINKYLTRIFSTICTKRLYHPINIINFVTSTKLHHQCSFTTFPQKRLWQIQIIIALKMIPCSFTVDQFILEIEFLNQR